ncbi:MAG: hypothetical protein AB7O97_09595 [Planctomycetota bacterium]
MRPRPILAILLTLTLATRGPASAQEPSAPRAPTPGPASRPAEVAPIRLTYDLSPYELGKLLDQRPDTDLEALVAEVIDVLRERVDFGCATFTHLRGTQFTVDIPAGAVAVPTIRQHVECRGQLEMRLVAFDAFGQQGRTLDLEADRRRLERWLDDGGREAVLADEHAIDAFHDDPERDETARAWVRWCPHIVRRRDDDPRVWDMTLQEIATLAPATVPLFSPAEWNRSVVPPGTDDNAQLVEYTAILVGERSFTGDDLDRRSVRAVLTPDGRPAVDYRLRPDRAADYAELTGRYTRRHLAITLDGRVLMAPLLASRIAGRGQIQVGRQADADWLEAVLQTRASPVTPALLRTESGPR